MPITNETFPPAIFSKRDKNGNLIDIVSTGEEASRESLVFIKALGNFNEETIEIIKNNIIEELRITGPIFSQLTNARSV